MNVYWPTGEPIEPTPKPQEPIDYEIERLRGVIERLEMEKHDLAERLGEAKALDAKWLHRRDRLGGYGTGRDKPLRRSPAGAVEECARELRLVLGGEL